MADRAPGEGAQQVPPGELGAGGGEWRQDQWATTWAAVIAGVAAITAAVIGLRPWSHCPASAPQGGAPQPRPDGDPLPWPTADRAALGRGLALLQLWADAAKPDVKPGAEPEEGHEAKPEKPGWVNRRVEQLDFLGTRAVRWRSSIDFVVPDTAPEVQRGARDFRLVPLTTLPKDDLVAFDLRDEQAEAMSLPTSVETSGLLAPALVYLAANLLKPKIADPPKPEDLPPGLDEDLTRIVAAKEHEKEYAPFAAAAALVDVRQCQDELTDVCCNRPGKVSLRHFRKWYEEQRKWARAWARAQDALSGALESLWRARQKLDCAEQCPDCPEHLFDIPREAQPRMVEQGKCRHCAAYRLMNIPSFRGQLEELAKNFVVHVAVASPPGTRRIVKWSSERSISFWSRKSAWRRLGQSLGVQCWPAEVPIGGTGGSHHLEVAAPPGVDIVRITAEPAVSREPGRPTVWRHGMSPHVHIMVPASASRSRAWVFVRTSRQGWLSASCLVAILIAIVMPVGRDNLSALFPTGVAASPESGTAATLLLALLGVIATWLVRPGQHPLASRLLGVVRILILIDIAVVLVGTGDLVLHHTTNQPKDLWLALAWVAGVIAGLVTLARLLPMDLPRTGE